MKKAGILEYPTGRLGELYREILDLDFPQNRFGAENAFSQVMQDSYGYTVSLNVLFFRRHITSLIMTTQDWTSFGLFLLLCFFFFLAGIKWVP